MIAHFDQWRWVLDHEGTKGWMHKSLLSTRRTVVFMDGVQTVRERPLTGSPAVLRAEAGVVADLLGCEDGWCRIALAGEEGWVPESALWGVARPRPTPAHPARGRKRKWASRGPGIPPNPPTTTSRSALHEACRSKSSGRRVAVTVRTPSSDRPLKPPVMVRSLSRNMVRS